MTQHQMAEWEEEGERADEAARAKITRVNISQFHESIMWLHPPRVIIIGSIYATCHQRTGSDVITPQLPTPSIFFYFFSPLMTSMSDLPSFHCFKNVILV